MLLKKEGSLKTKALVVKIAALGAAGCGNATLARARATASWG